MVIVRVQAEPPHSTRPRQMSIFSAIFDGVIDFDAKHVPSHRCRTIRSPGDNGSRRARQYGKLIGDD
jgi:hypothetical protein